MNLFHESIGSEAYKISYDRPDLIDLIQHHLLKTGFFDSWVDEDTLKQHCIAEYDIAFTGVQQALDNAAAKGPLIRNPDTGMKSYRKNPKAGK